MGGRRAADYNSPMMKALLYDAFVASRRNRLAGLLDTKWELVPVLDALDVDKVRSQLPDVDAFIGSTFHENWRTAAGNLRLIQCVGAGVDSISNSSIPPGCTLCNVYEHETPIAEYIMLAVLLFVTRLMDIKQRFRQGIWTDSGRFDGRPHDEVYGKTLGLVGYGHIGRETARRAKAFGMKVAAVARRPRPEPEVDWYGRTADLDELIEMSDFLTIVCPLTEHTRGLIGERELGKLKSSAVLINVARAEIVREEPLFRALRERWFAGAVLDVWYRYPPGPGTGGHGSKLAFHELDNVIVTPHASAWTDQMIERRLVRIAENLNRLARGEMLQQVVHQATVGVSAG